MSVKLKLIDPQLVSPSSRGPDDTTITPVQEVGATEKSRRTGAELSRISEDDRHRSSDHHTHTQVRLRVTLDACFSLLYVFFFRGAFHLFTIIYYSLCKYVLLV